MGLFKRAIILLTLAFAYLNLGVIIGKLDLPVKISLTESTQPRPALLALFNGLKYSSSIRGAELLKDSDQIVEFYGRDHGMEHGWVVLRTKKGDAFRCELTIPNHKTGIEIAITKASWQPESHGFPVKKSGVGAKQLQDHIKEFMKGYGGYNAGFNDCRHFSQEVMRFLAKA